MPPPPAAAAARHWEQLLVENWLVWLGGAALALGGVFLVKLSIDYGVLTPGVRVVLGIALGIGLSVAAEWVRRRDPPQPGEPRRRRFLCAASARRRRRGDRVRRRLCGAMRSTT